MAKVNQEHFLNDIVNYRDIFGAFDEGVIITDKNGRIMFYNNTQMHIDSVKTPPIGELITSFYQLTRDTSLIMRCLSTQQPILNKHLLYKTRLGRTTNSLCSVFPLFNEEGLVGSVCFVRDYNLLETTITSVCSRGEEPLTSRNLQGLLTFSDIIGTSTAISEAVKTAKMAALTPSPVMMVGETGAGKEIFAQAMHQFGPRKDAANVTINCAAIPENLLEGILFGTVKGAFTGAIDKQGLFEKADNGTLFLDEINSMPLGLQAKLLRVIQEKKFRRVGSLEERAIDVKILSSVNEDPHAAIDERRLRVDLFYRLGVVLLHLPSLRERREDIPLLAAAFIEKFNKALGRNVEGLSKGVIERFTRHEWPGNVRELQHIIEGAMNVVGNRRLIDLKDLPPHMLRDTAPHSLRRSALNVGGSVTIEGNLREGQSDLELAAITAAMERSNGNISRAAADLGLSRQLLHYKLKKYGLKREAFKI